MIDELSALDRIKERFSDVSKDVYCGIGDDAAAFKIHPKNLVLLSTDSQVEGVHFKKDLISAIHLARRALAVSLSDIAAMGGIPRFFLTTLGFSDKENEDYFEKLMLGFQKGCDEFNVELVGGNLSSSHNLIIDITVVGEVEPDNMVKRSGARPGDLTYISGTVGDSALGLKLLLQGSTYKSDDELISRHILPQPRIALGRELARRKLVSSMIDVSDGLIIDLERITTKYGIGAEIHTDEIPLSHSYKNIIRQSSENPYELALTGGEDYELLFTSSQKHRDNINEISDSLNIEITEIGYITDTPNVSVLDTERKRIKLKKRGFVHFNA